MSLKEDLEEIRGDNAEVDEFEMTGNNGRHTCFSRTRVRATGCRGKHKT